MFLELFHVRLSWCKVIFLYQCGHKHAYALSEFLPQRWKRDNRLQFCQKINLKSQKKVRIYPQKWSDRSQNFLFFNENLSVGALIVHCALHALCIAYIVHCMRCALHPLCIKCVAYCMCCALHVMCIACIVHCIRCALHAVCITCYMRCMCYALHALCIACIMHCMDYALHASGTIIHTM